MSPQQTTVQKTPILFYCFCFVSSFLKKTSSVYFLCIRTEKYAGLLSDYKNNRKVKIFYRKQLSVLLKYQSICRTHTSIFYIPFISEAIVSL